MKKFLFLLNLVFISLNGIFAQTSKVLVKSIKIENTSVVVSKTLGSYHIEEWDQPYLRIRITINANNCTDAVLGKLIAVGRYDLEVEEEQGGYLSIDLPKTQYEVMIRGTHLEEEFEFHIQAPKDIQFENISGQLIAKK